MIDILIEDARWDAFNLQSLADPIAHHIANRLDLAGEIEVAVLAADDAKIAELNAQFRGKAQPTNVLSWPAHDLSPGPSGWPDPPDDLELGDIALAFETCAREAAEQGKAPQAHLSHLLAHGILHLLGFDHLNDTQADVMESLEVEILAKLDISNPYEETISN